MKNVALILLLVGLAGAVVWGMGQAQKTKSQQAELAGLRSQLAAAEGEVEGLKAAQEKAAARERELARMVEDLGSQLRKLKGGGSNTADSASAVAQAAPEQTGGTNRSGMFGRLLSTLMKDPEMKQMVRDGQRSMVGQMYDPLMKQLQLSPEEQTRFKEILADQTGRMTEKGMALLTARGEQRDALIAELAEDQRKNDAELQQFLGDGRYQQYKDYQYTIGERMALNQFKDRNGLTDDQNEQLLQIIREEKQSAQVPQAPFTPGSDPSALQSMMSEEQTRQILATQQQVNQRVLDRAGTVLQPDQLSAYGRFQTNQLNQLRGGINMTRGLLGGQGP